MLLEVHNNVNEYSDVKRYFKFWVWSASHSRLLIRSPIAGNRVDIVFYGVYEISLPTQFYITKIVKTGDSDDYKGTVFEFWDDDKAIGHLRALVMSYAFDDKSFIDVSHFPIGPLYRMEE